MIRWVAKGGITDAVIADSEELGMTIAAGREMGFINCNAYWQEAGQPTDPVTIDVKTVKCR